MKQIKHLFALLCLVLAAMPSFAQEIKIDSPVLFGNNDAVNVPVYFSTDKEIVGMQFDILLPDFLEFAGDVIKNQDRFDNHIVVFNQQNGRLLIGQMDNLPLKGDEGVLLSVPVKVKSGTATGTFGDIKVNGIKFTNVSGAETFLQDSFVVRAEFNDVEVSFSVEPASLLINPGSKTTVNFNYTANCDLYSMQAVFILPEGLSIVGDPVLGSVCSTDGYGKTYHNADNTKIICADFSNTPLSAQEGTYFTFTVEAAEDFNGESCEIKVQDMVATYTTDGKFVRPENFTIAVESSINAYNSLMEQIATARTSVSDMLAAIAEECPDVKDQFTGEAITEKIDALEAAVTEAHGNGTLNAKAAAFAEEIEAINAEIEKTLQDAREAESQFKADAANKAAFDRMNEALTATDKTLTDALAAIVEECPDVRDDFKGEELTAKVDALKTQLNSWNEEGACVENEEEFNAAVAELEEAIEAYKAAAVAAEEQFKTEQAAANKAAYDRLAEKLAAARTSLANMLADIAEKCPDVKDDFKAEEIAAGIDAIASEIETLNEKGECVDNEQDLNVRFGEIADAINEYLAEAIAAEEKFKLDAANRAAYDKVIAEIDALQDELDAMVKYVAETYPGASVTQFVYIAQSAIDKARSEADSAFAAVADAGEFDYTVDADTIRALIAEIELMAQQLGVSEIDVDDIDADSVIYTISGRRVLNPTAGVYIIVSRDGKAKKVTVK